jgi:tetratricopeptide (TPR) repeat protein
MRGVFRISLPPGWQPAKVIDDRHTVAAFSNQDLTLEVIRDANTVSVEQYAQIVTERRLLPEADEYTGKYAPKEVRSNPASFVADVTHRFDEYTLISGLPARWARYHYHYSHPAKEGEPAKANDPAVHDAIVWSVFTLSPDDYWRLELRGDEKAAWSGDLQRMVRSFQLLEPTAGRVKALVPREAWARMPSGLANGTCQFVGFGSGMGALVPCDWDMTDQQQNAIPKGSAKLTLAGSDRLSAALPVTINFLHFVGSLPADELTQDIERVVSGSVNSYTTQSWNGKYSRWKCDYWNEDEDGYVPCRRDAKTVTQNLEYHRDALRQVMVDGYPGTLITATGTAKKTHKTVSYRILTVSKGTDHFVAYGVFNPSACSNCPVDQILNSLRLYALRPKAEGFVEKMVARIDPDKLAAQLMAEPAGPPAPPSAQELDYARENVRLFNNSPAHFHLGELLDRGEDHEAAFQEFRTAAHLNPRNEEANRKLAQAYTSSNETVNAIAAYERILYYEAEPEKDVATHGQLAMLYAQAGAKVVAANHLSRAGDSAPQNVMSDAELEAANKQLEDLAAQLEKANKNYDANPNTENSLADADLGRRVGDFGNAHRMCRNVNESDPKNLRALNCLADTAYARGEGSSVIEFARQWLALAPNDPGAHFWLARGHACDPADYRKAAESYEAVVRHADEQFPASLLREAQVSWPRAYEEEEMWPEAARAHEAVASLFPKDPQVLNDTAWFYGTTTSNMKNPAKALAYAQRAVAAAPKNPNILDTLAQAYLVNNRVDEAIATEQKALALAPGREDLLKRMEEFKQAQHQRRK